MEINNIRRQLAQNGYVIREKESFAYTIEIKKPFGGLDPVIAWCKQELLAEWRWQLGDVSTDVRPGRYIFYFDNEQDYLAFVMKWS